MPSNHSLHFLKELLAMNLHQKGATSPKSVHFAKTCEMYLIPCLDEYTEKEKDSIWMPAQDFQRIREECLAVASKLNSGIPEDENLCYRGLEWKAEAVLGRRHRRRSRQRAAFAVFDEQDQQWYEGVTNPEQIRAAYKMMTEISGHDAFLRAIRDSKVSMEACRESGKPKRESDLRERKPAKNVSPFPRRSRASIALSFPEVKRACLQDVPGGGFAKSA
jgi:hypothetical protein